MPMYYFHLSNDDKVTDVDGTDLANVAAARIHAIRVARELTFKSEGLLDHSLAVWRMLVHDDGGIELFSLPLSDFE